MPLRNASGPPTKSPNIAIGRGARPELVHRGGRAGCCLQIRHRTAARRIRVHSGTATSKWPSMRSGARSAPPLAKSLLSVTTDMRLTTPTRTTALSMMRRATWPIATLPWMRLTCDREQPRSRCSWPRAGPPAPHRPPPACPRLTSPGLSLVQHRAGDPRAAATYRHAIRDAVADDGRLNARRAPGSSRGDRSPSPTAQVVVRDSERN